MSVIAHPAAASEPLTELAFNTLGSWLGKFGATVEREPLGQLERLAVTVNGRRVLFANSKAICRWLSYRLEKDDAH